MSINISLIDMLPIFIEDKHNIYNIYQWILYLIFINTIHTILIRKANPMNNFEFILLEHHLCDPNIDASKACLQVLKKWIQFTKNL